MTGETQPPSLNEQLGGRLIQVHSKLAQIQVQTITHGLYRETTKYMYS